jgi:hypothetical protein
VVGALSLAMPPVAAGFVGLLAMIYPLVRIMLIGPEMVVARHSTRSAPSWAALPPRDERYRASCSISDRR